MIQFEIKIYKENVNTESLRALGVDCLLTNQGESFFYGN